VEGREGGVGARRRQPLKSMSRGVSMLRHGVRESTVGVEPWVGGRLGLRSWVGARLLSTQVEGV
jgi:hypothetical protein